MQRNDIIRTIRGQVGSGDPGNPISCGMDGLTPRENYFINPNTRYDYFIVPVVIEHNEQSQRISLVFSSRDFYLHGFINDRIYYYFNEENNLDNISGYESQNLNFSGSYTDLIPSGNPEITWSGIQDAFFQLYNMGTSHQPETNILKASLMRVVLSTSESIRFRSVQDLIRNSVSTHTFPGIRVYWEKDFVPIIKKWSRITKDAIDFLSHNNNLINFDRIHSILVFTYLIANYFNNCNNNQRQPRDLNNNVEYCVFSQNSITVSGEELHSIRSLTTDNDGNIYTSGEGKIYKSNGFDNFKSINNLDPLRRVSVLITDNKNNIYASVFWQPAENDRVFKINISNNYVLSRISGIPLEESIISLTTDKDGNVYAGSKNGKIYKSNGTDQFTKLNGPQITGNIMSLITDKDGNVYAGNDKCEIFKFYKSHNQFLKISNEWMTGKGKIFSLILDNDGYIYASGDKGKIYTNKYKNDDFTSLSVGDDDENIYSLKINNDGYIYASSDKGKIYKKVDYKDFLEVFRSNFLISSLLNNNNFIYILSHDEAKVYRLSI